jgi:hypothetical protein
MVCRNICNYRYSLYMHRQPPPYDYDIEDCKAMLLNEAEKPHTYLEKIMVDEVINEYVSKTSVASLPMLSYNDEQQQGQNSSTSLDNS